MASLSSYTITLENNKSEKEAINFLLETNPKFILPNRESRKRIMEILSIPINFARAFDLILLKGKTSLDDLSNIDFENEVILVELKTTKKKLHNLPIGFFFGATESEFNLATLLGDKYNFCFVSLHPESKSYCLLTLSELESKIKTKRIQYQINL